MSLGVKFHPHARTELFADVDWYDEREPTLGGRFEVAVRSAIDAAAASPESRSVWPGWDRVPLVRSKRVGEFPFRVVNLVDGDELIVVAAAHTKRRPGYWRARVPRPDTSV